MADRCAVRLYRPDGGTVIDFDDVEVLSWNKDTIEFRYRTETEDTVTLKDYTSNLPYLIIETTKGSKKIL